MRKVIKGWTDPLTLSYFGTKRVHTFPQPLVYIRKQKRADFGDDKFPSVRVTITVEYEE